MEKLLSIFFFAIINYKYERSNTMGFFSWMTEEGDSISNSSSSRGALPVYMYLPDGTVRYEPEYEGYGVFDGLDFYALVAQYNQPEKCTGDVDKDRDVGIAYEYHSGVAYNTIIMPRFSRYKNLDYNKMTNPEVCNDQGYFYWEEKD
jgi:hypothetical protein